MPLVTVYSDEVRLDQATRYEELIQEVAQAAVKREEKWNWTAHQVSFGNVGAFHYVAEAPDWATIQRRGEVEDLIRRLLGEQRGNEVLQQQSSNQILHPTHDSDASRPIPPTRGAARSRPGRRGSAAKKE